MPVRTGMAAVVGTMALTGGLLLGGCGSGTTVQGLAQGPTTPASASWTCTREGETLTCICEGTEAACADSVAEPSQVKGATGGTVRYFNEAKGYGFIVPDGGGEELFVWFRDIQADGYTVLRDGQKVTFDVAPGPRGPQAYNVRITDI